MNKTGVIEGKYIVTFKNQFDSLISDQIASQTDKLQSQILSANAIKQETIHGTVTNDPDSFDDKILVLPSDLDAYVSGPSFVSNGHQGTWTAQTSGGEPPLNYRWYRNNYGSPPYWQTVGWNSSYSTTVTQSFELKVHVTDASNTTVITDVKSVSTN